MSYKNIKTGGDTDHVNIERKGGEEIVEVRFIKRGGEGTTEERENKFTAFFIFGYSQKSLRNSYHKSHFSGLISGIINSLALPNETQIWNRKRREKRI